MNNVNNSIYEVFDILYTKVKENECEVKDFHSLLIDSFNSVFGDEGYNIFIKSFNVYRVNYLYCTVCLNKGVYFLDIEFSIHIVMDCPRILITKECKFLNLFNFKIRKKISSEKVLIKSIRCNLISLDKYEQSLDSLMKQETIKSKRNEIYNIINSNDTIDIKKTIGLLEEYNELLSLDVI